MTKNVSPPVKKNILTPFEKDPHCETCATLQKTPVFPVLQT